MLGKWCQQRHVYLFFTFLNASLLILVCNTIDSWQIDRRLSKIQLKDITIKAMRDDMSTLVYQKLPLGDWWNLLGVTKGLLPLPRGCHVHRRHSDVCSTEKAQFSNDRRLNVDQLGIEKPHRLFTHAVTAWWAASEAGNTDDPTDWLLGMALS